MAYVYRHSRNDTNEVFYIGISSIDDGNYKRSKAKWGRSKYWNNIVNLTGYTIEIIEDNLPWEEACEREKYWIKYYGRWDLHEGTLVNFANGGEGTIGYHHTDEAKLLISIAMTGREISDETKQKLSDINKGKMPSLQTIEAGRIANTGRITSESTKQKLRDANKYTSESKRLKCSIASKSASKESREIGANKRRLINRSDSEILKMQSQMREVIPTISKRHTPTQLLNNKLNQPRRRQISQYDFNNNLIKIWDSITDARKVYGGSISSCLKGTASQSRGYYWRYTDELPAGRRVGGKTKK